MTLKPAAEWAADILNAEWPLAEAVLRIVESVQRDAMTAGYDLGWAAAVKTVKRALLRTVEECQKRSNATIDCPYDFAAGIVEDCANGIDALIPTAEHGEITKEAET